MIKLKLKPVLFIAVALFFLFLGAIFALPVFKKEYTEVKIGNASVIAEVVRDPRSQELGLGRRKNLPENAGMLFVFSKLDNYAIWMKDMEFPIDIFWIKNNTVVDMKENVANPKEGTPDRLLAVYRPQATEQYILEVNAGFAAKNNITIGSPANFIFNGGVDSTLEKQNIQSSFSNSVNGPTAAGINLFTIPALKNKLSNGREFKIIKKIAENPKFTSYQISYNSDGLIISGGMNIPSVTMPQGGFPVIIIAHEEADATSYKSGMIDEREQSFFADNGFATLLPDYRGFGDSGSYHTHYDFNAGYIRDVSNLIDAIKQNNYPILNSNRVGILGISLGGEIAEALATIRRDVKAYVLFSPQSADFNDTIGGMAQDEKNFIFNSYGTDTSIYGAVSPINYFNEVSSPIQIHQGINDTVVPIGYSERAYETLNSLGKNAEFYSYPGEGHLFTNLWSLAVSRALRFFDKFVKNNY